MPCASPASLHACRSHAAGTTRTLLMTLTICYDQDYGFDCTDEWVLEEDDGRSDRLHLLWGDFGAAQIIPHLTRHSPEAQVGC